MMAQVLIPLEIPVLGMLATKVDVETTITQISSPLLSAVPVVVVTLQHQNGTSTLIMMLLMSILQSSLLLTKITREELLMFLPDGRLNAMLLMHNSGITNLSQKLLLAKSSMRRPCAPSSPGSLMAHKSRVNLLLKFSQMSKTGCSKTTIQKVELLLRHSEWRIFQEPH